jgi:hypothetical protein
MVTRTIPLLALVALGGAFAAGAPAQDHSVRAVLVIHHQVQGCHEWSLNEGPDRVKQSVAIRAGQSISVTNDDVMPHQLVETSGPAVVYTRISLGAPMGRKGPFPPAMLARIGAESAITFTKAGVYHFRTKAGDDYMPNLTTVGPDNVLRLTVRVG